MTLGLPVDLPRLSRADTRTRFDVEQSGLRYACLLRTFARADILFVMLKSSVDRSRETLPTFWRAHLGEDRWALDHGPTLKGHVLCVCDPTLFLDEALSAGAFLGDHERDAVGGLIEIVRAVAERMTISTGRIVFWGASGAGFGALMAAVRQGADGKAIAVNPPIDLGRFWPLGRALSAVQSFGREGTITDLGAELSARSSVTARLKTQLSAGARPRLAIVQNVEDVVYHKRHFTPFCRAFGVPEQGGLDPSGSIMSLIYSDPGGHTAIPEDVVRRECAEALPFLFSEGATPCPA